MARKQEPSKVDEAFLALQKIQTELLVRSSQGALTPEWATGAEQRIGAAIEDLRRTILQARRVLEVGVG